MNMQIKKLCFSKVSQCILCSLLITPFAHGAYEAKSYAVTTWDASCSGSTRSAWDNMADAWYDEITNTGFSLFGWCLSGHCSDAFTRDGQYVNGNIINSKFADSSLVSWGNDTRHLDEGDAVMLALHGFESGNDYGGRVRVNESGGGNCNIMRSEMELGDSDLEFLHLSSCQSMDDNQWSTWWSAFGRAHQVDGFHGLMWIGSSLVNDYKDFADDAFSSTIAESWLDNMYIPDISGSDDQCPVAYAVGANSTDTWNRIGTERYDNVHSDPSSIGYWGVIYIRGCDPAAESVIASDFSS